MAIFPIFYFPPISYFQELLKQENIILENAENLVKQSYRNRCEIVSANGKLNLIIPLQHSGNRKMKDIKISNSENWQHLHLKSIKTAYQRSPYFEYYEDHFVKLYQTKQNYLLDFTLETMQKSFDIFKIPFEYSLSNEYKTEYEYDFRNKFSAKELQKNNINPYIQVFSDRMEFQKDVSIIDLICNIGTNCATYLKK